MNLSRFCFIPLIFAATHVHPWSVSPSSQTILESKPQAFFTITADDRDTILPVEVFGGSRHVDEEGHDSWERNEEDFIIYPKHIMLKKGQSQLVRVIWKGKEKIYKEKAFRLIFQEQPTAVPETLADVHDKDGKAQFAIGVNTQYVCSLYVQKSKRGQPKVEVTDYHFADVDGKKYLNIHLHNSGAKHRILKSRNMEFVVKYKDKSNKVQTLQLDKDLIVENIPGIMNILVDHTRKVQIPWNDELPQQFDSIILHD